jgi:hypothetical protein
MGWSGTKNGQLLALAAADFDAFVTVDKNLPHQQNLASLPIAVVLLDAHSVELKALLPLVSALEQALLSLAPRTFIRVVAAPDQVWPHARCSPPKEWYEPEPRREVARPWEVLRPWRTDGLRLRSSELPNAED